jgi:thymidylate kinase
MSGGGRLIVFEGIDGVGKSTLAHRLSTFLLSKGTDVVSLSFPGQEPETLGAHIYGLYHSPAKFGISSITALATHLVMTAAHVDVIESRILPALERKATVVLDRCWWSTCVYGRRDGVRSDLLDRLLDIERLLMKGVRPDPLFLILRPNSTHPVAMQERERLYLDLARKEAGNYQVHLVHNTSTIDDALQVIMDLGGF